MSKNAHPERVKAAIRETGLTLSKLALANGLQPTTVHKALRRRTPAGNRAIAAYLGQSLHELWPEWFKEDGSNRSQPVNDTSVNRRAHGQKRKAA